MQQGLAMNPAGSEPSSLNRNKGVGEGRGMKTDHHPREGRPPAGPVLNKDQQWADRPVGSG